MVTEAEKEHPGGERDEGPVTRAIILKSDSWYWDALLHTSFSVSFYSLLNCFIYLLQETHFHPSGSFQDSWVPITLPRMCFHLVLYWNSDKENCDSASFCPTSSSLKSGRFNWERLKTPLWHPKFYSTYDRDKGKMLCGFALAKYGPMVSYPFVGHATNSIIHPNNGVHNPLITSRIKKYSASPNSLLKAIIRFVLVINWHNQKFISLP